MVICLERSADNLHMVRLMLLPQKNPEWFILLVLTYLGIPGQKL